MIYTAPATDYYGIVVLNDAGRITFANGEARRLLDIGDAAGSLMSPDWDVRIGAGHNSTGVGRRDFLQLVHSEALLDVPVLVSWPSGWHRHLVVNTAPLHKGSGSSGGMVAAFLEREPLPATARG